MSILKPADKFTHNGVTIENGGITGGTTHEKNTAIIMHAQALAMDEDGFSATDMAQFIAEFAEAQKGTSKPEQGNPNPPEKPKAVEGGPKTKEDPKPDEIKTKFEQGNPNPPEKTKASGDPLSDSAAVKDFDIKYVQIMEESRNCGYDIMHPLKGKFGVEYDKWTDEQKVEASKYLTGLAGTGEMTEEDQDKIEKDLWLDVGCKDFDKSFNKLNDGAIAKKLEEKFGVKDGQWTDEQKAKASDYFDAFTSGPVMSEITEKDKQDIRYNLLASKDLKYFNITFNQLNDGVIAKKLEEKFGVKGGQWTDKQKEDAGKYLTDLIGTSEVTDEDKTKLKKDLGIAVDKPADTKDGFDTVKSFKTPEDFKKSPDKTGILDGKAVTKADGKPMETRDDYITHSAASSIDQNNYSQIDNMLKHGDKQAANDLFARFDSGKKGFLTKDDLNAMDRFISSVASYTRAPPGSRGTAHYEINRVTGTWAQPSDALVELFQRDKTFITHSLGKSIPTYKEGDW